LVHGGQTRALGGDHVLDVDPLVHDEFESDELGTLVFQKDAAGRVSGLSVFAGRIRNLVFKKTE
jgi:hypothetical protein